MSLEGVLSDFGVGEIFQLIGQQRKTGVLEIKRGETCFEVLFVEGQVLRARPAETRPDGALAGFLLRTGAVADTALAEARREQEQTLDPLGDVLIRNDAVAKEVLEEVSTLMSDETIFELFLWDEGRFAFRPAERIDSRPGDRLRGAEGVLLDALRMKDEWSQVEGSLPDFSGVPCLQRVEGNLMEALAALSQATHVEARIFEQICSVVDGQLSVRRVLDLARVGTFEGARAVAALVDRGILRIRLQSEETAPEEPAQVAGLRVEAVLPYAPLAVAPLVLLLFLWPGPRTSTFPIAGSPIADAHSEAEVQRLEAALEAFRWATGGYPESLAQLRAEAPALLATVGLDGYSYERTSRGYRLRHVSGTETRVEGREATRDETRGGSDRAPEASPTDETREPERPS